MKSLPFLFVMLLACLPAAGWAFGLGLSPTTVEMTVKPAEQKRQVIRVANVNPKKKLALTVGVADWTLDDQGQLKLFPPGQGGRSAANWLRFSPAAFTLEPGEGKQIVVDIAPPAKLDSPGDYRAALLISTLLPPEDQRPEVTGVWNRYQVASLFYFTLQPAKSLPEVLSLSLQPDGKQQWLRMKIRNTGNAHARIKGDIQVLDETGKMLLTLPVNSVLMEGQERQVSMKLDTGELAPGHYRLGFKLKNAFAPQVEKGEMPLKLGVPAPELRVGSQ